MLEISRRRRITINTMRSVHALQKVLVATPLLCCCNKGEVETFPVLIEGLEYPLLAKGARIQG